MATRVGTMVDGRAIVDAMIASSGTRLAAPAGLVAPHLSARLGFMLGADGSVLGVLAALALDDGARIVNVILGERVLPCEALGQTVRASIATDRSAPEASGEQDVTGLARAVARSGLVDELVLAEPLCTLALGGGESYRADFGLLEAVEVVFRA